VRGRDRGEEGRRSREEGSTAAGSAAVPPPGSGERTGAGEIALDNVVDAGTAGAGAVAGKAWHEPCLLVYLMPSTYSVSISFA